MLALKYVLTPGPGEFGEALEQVQEGVERSLSNVSQVANDAAGIMAQVVTQDTGELARQMRIIEQRVEGTISTYVLGSTALNRSGLEYAYYEHMRHEGSSFLDRGEQYANDMLFEGTASILNSIN
jgi:hypothetical protein